MIPDTSAMAVEISVIECFGLSGNITNRKLNEVSINHKWRFQMNLTRIKSLIVVLGVACLALVMVAGTAFALTGATRKTTTAPLPIPTYSVELAGAGTVYGVPNGYNVLRQMTVIRTFDQGDDFFMDLILQDGATWVVGKQPFPLVGGVCNTTTYPACWGVSAITSGWAASITGVSVSGAVARYGIHITTVSTPPEYPQFKIPQTWTGTEDGVANNVRITDVNGVLATPGGGTIHILIETRDQGDNIQFDPTGGDQAVDTAPYIKSGYGATTCNFSRDAMAAGPAVIVGAATIDVYQARLGFVLDTYVDQYMDWSGRICINTNGGLNGPILLNTGAPSFSSTSADFVKYTFSGNWIGVKCLQIGNYPAGTGACLDQGYTVTAADRTAGFVTISVPADHGFLTDFDGAHVRFTVDGTTPLDPRTFQVAVNYVPASPGLTRNLISTTNITVWSMNGTILVCNFLNGNTDAFVSRSYLWNPTSIPGPVQIDVYTLVADDSANPRVWLGTVPFGANPAFNMAGVSGVNIKTQDVLSYIGIATPYTTNGGNLTFVFSIGSPGDTGVCNVFDRATTHSMSTSPALNPFPFANINFGYADGGGTKR
jgi:hypothetical protein